ncbi:hypothetical protein RHMOL_Rhmol05G0234400 [Rhododendron molle]|uniref:Uncharacterized protein n=1 Tax=Rhododendron molle TaxID=49168 RepID=A0ACC0NTG4_RHOML|nr:hypothetical protein RHMOL_Rhmol05G0234400 [Rhododendron molle]
MFAEKVVDQQCLPSLTLMKTLFAQAVVIVLISSQVPFAMDLVLCQLNRACIYMAPKHITYSKSLFGTKEAYREAIGYKEEDRAIESEESLFHRGGGCPKQTWSGRRLGMVCKVLECSPGKFIYCSCIAGIPGCALKEQGQDAKLTIDIASIQSYIESNKFLEEPEGRSLQSSILSRLFSG